MLSIPIFKWVDMHSKYSRPLIDFIGNVSESPLSFFCNELIPHKFTLRGAKISYAFLL